MDLTDSIPDIISDLLGYSVVPQQLQQNQLQAGDMFNTTNVVKIGSGVNGVPAYIPIEVKTTNTMTQVGQAAVGLTLHATDAQGPSKPQHTLLCDLGKISEIARQCSFRNLLSDHQLSGPQHKSKLQAAAIDCLFLSIIVNFGGSTSYK